MPDWWSAVNTLIGSVLLVFGWGIRREFGKIDKILTKQEDMGLKVAQMEERTAAHNELDDRRFADHEKWLGRLDARLEMQR